MTYVDALSEGGRKRGTVHVPSKLQQLMQILLTEGVTIRVQYTYSQLL